MIAAAAHRPATHRAFVQFIRWFVVVAMAIAVTCYVAWTWRWRLAVDSPVMHYVVFLMHHGFRPYKDISDSNMPGSYMTEAAAMHLFGQSDLGWRMYEFFLLGAMTCAMIFITRRRDWVAGVFAGGLFIVLHGAEGPQYAAERELIITTLLLVAFAILFGAVRYERPWLTVIFGFLCGIAASIKPTYFVVAPGILALTLFLLWRKGTRAWAYGIWGILGILPALALDALFLHLHGALHAFFGVAQNAVPGYVAMGRLGFVELAKRMLPHAAFALLAAAICLLVVNWRKRDGWDWERWILAAGACLGLLSYFAQGKGFLHHRYELMAFLLVLISLEIFTSLHIAGWPAFVAGAVACAAIISIVPLHLRTVRSIPPSSSFELTLEHDLNSLGGTAQLQRKVECLDLVYGCLNALYHLDLVQSMPTTGDLGLYLAEPSPVVDPGHRGFLNEIERTTDVLVISNEILFEPGNTFGKIDRFPGLRDLLNREYALAVQRDFPHEKFAFYHRDPVQGCDSYRIYVRKASPAARRVSLLSTRTVAVP